MRLFQSLGLVARKATPSASRRISFDAAQREALFESQTRWLWNDKEQRSIRRVNFDPDALQKIACKALGAKACTEFKPMMEGSYNRTYRLSFDNGEQATLKIPFLLPGHTSRRTSSEVATLQFFKDIVSKDSTFVPVPDVLAWSAQKETTPVGSEFILLKYVPGVMLAERWDEPNFDTWAIYHPLFTYENIFQQAAFAGIGSLYFKEDVSAELQQRPLFSGAVPSHYEVVKDKYRVGPLADRQHWRGPRGDSMYDHGPWPDMLSFFTSVAKNQLLYLKHHAKDDAPFRRPPFHSRKVHASILETYLETIPLILPPEETQTAMIWHPDINGPNIIVDPENRPTGTPPPLLIVNDDEFGFKPKDGVRDPDPFPDNPAERGIRPEDEPRARTMYERIRRMMYYIGKLLTVPEEKPRAKVLAIPHTDIIGMLPFHIIRSWEDGIIPIRKALYEIHDSWDDLAPSGAAPPASLVKICLNRELNKAEHDRWDAWISAIDYSLDWIACRGDGLLADEESTAKKTRAVLPDLKDQWENDDQFPGPWPFEDGHYSFFLT